MATDAEGIATVDIQTCLQLLCTREVGRLAVSITDHPDIFPIVKGQQDLPSGGQ